jgi:hypothetical protein
MNEECIKQRADFLSRVSFSIFGFLIALILQNFHPDWLRMYPFYANWIPLLIALFMVSLFSIFYFFIGIVNVGKNGDRIGLKKVDGHTF